MKSHALSCRVYPTALLVFSAILCFAQNPKQETKASDFDKKPEVQWKLRINAPIVSTPVISENTVYFGALDSTLYAIDLSTGAVRWKFKTNGEIRSTVAIHDDKLFLLGGNGVFSCWNKASGKIIWRKVFDNTALYIAERKYDFADYYHSSPLIDDNVIYFGSGNGRMNAIRAESGETLWTFKAGDIIHNTPVITGDKIFFGSFDGYVYALHTATGSLAWKFKSVGHKYFPQGEMQGFPAAANGLVYFGSRDFNVYALDANEGYAHWNRRLMGGWGLSTSARDTMLYVGTSDDRVLMALDGRSGQEIWKTNVKFQIFGSCAFTPSMVYVGTIWGKAYGLDRKTGAIRWAFSTEGYERHHLQYFKEDDTYRDDFGRILRAPIDWILAEYKMGGIFSAPAIAGDMMVITSTEGIVYGLKRS